MGYFPFPVFLYLCVMDQWSLFSWCRSVFSQQLLAAADSGSLKQNHGPLFAISKQKSKSIDPSVFLHETLVSVGLSVVAAKATSLPRAWFYRVFLTEKWYFEKDVPKHGCPKRSGITFFVIEHLFLNKTPLRIFSYKSWLQIHKSFPLFKTSNT